MLYKENILEIVDNWTGYPVEIPCSDHDDDGRIPGQKPAINAECA